MWAYLRLENQKHTQKKEEQREKEEGRRTLSHRGRLYESRTARLLLMKKHKQLLHQIEVRISFSKTLIISSLCHFHGIRVVNRDGCDWMFTLFFAELSLLLRILSGICMHGVVEVFVVFQASCVEC